MGASRGLPRGAPSGGEPGRAATRSVGVWVPTVVRAARGRLPAAVRAVRVGEGGGSGARRAARWAAAAVCGALWWWAVLRLTLAPDAGVLEGAVAAGGWGLSLLPVHCVSRDEAARTVRRVWTVRASGR